MEHPLEVQCSADGTTAQVTWLIEADGIGYLFAVDDTEFHSTTLDGLPTTVDVQPGQEHSFYIHAEYTTHQIDWDTAVQCNPTELPFTGTPFTGLALVASLLLTAGVQLVRTARA